MLKIGSKVVCIGPIPKSELSEKELFYRENKETIYDYVDGGVSEGVIYVVDGFTSDPAWSSLGLKLLGKRVIALIGPNKGENVGWDSRMFRELEELQMENKLKQAMTNPLTSAPPQV